MSRRKLKTINISNTSYPLNNYISNTITLDIFKCNDYSYSGKLDTVKLRNLLELVSH